MKAKILLYLSLSICAVPLTWSQSFFPDKVKVETVPNLKPRNVVFILSDDHRYDAMSFMGHPFIETPVLDKMAKSGAHLKNAFVTTSLCSPSRASILTGLYTHKHGVVDNQRLEPDDILYFPQYLQKAGYNTAYIGKWHMGHASDEPRKGFDHWVSFVGQGHYLSPSPNYTFNVNGERVKQKGYITDELTDYAVDWLLEQKDADQPFFMYLSHKAVHSNFTPAERHAGRYSDVDWDYPESGYLTEEQLSKLPRWRRDARNSWHGRDFPYHSNMGTKAIYKRYCEAFLAVDESIGRVMDTLKELGVYEDTLVIYMGDNGHLFGEHGLIDKRVPYEASIRVPMLMQCPNLFEGGQVVEEVVANIDISATIFEAAGIKTPGYMDGSSMLPLVSGEPYEWRKNFLYVYYWEWRFPMTPTVMALRQDRYKFITTYGLWDIDELYDMENDPTESNNLIAEPKYQEIAKSMQDELYAMLADAGGMFIPLKTPPEHRRLNLRWTEKDASSAEFPESLIVEEAPNTNAM